MTVNRLTYRLVVDRAKFELRVYRWRKVRYARVATHPIAVGMVGHETPKGVYKILSKTLDPPWWMPKADWVAPELRGKMVPPDDPNNPIKGAFLQVTKDPTGNIGIHGTADLASLGSRASHGCIRVHPDVAVHLYRTVPKYTRVRII